MDEQIILIFQFIVFIFSVMIHEISHGAVALRLGDPTAKNAGRLTLNPIKHIDLFGSILLPLLLVTIKSPFLFGWAKPVPYNPMNLRDPKRGSGLIAAAGPVSNLLVAAFFGIIYRMIDASGTTTPGAITLAGFAASIVAVNVALALFNLIPIPPLDGSGILFSILPERFSGVQHVLSRYGFYILLFLMFTGGFNFITPIAQALFSVFVGS
ncbi:MAG: site-2 protease family protein [Patescibacteria group bacterium]